MRALLTLDTKALKHNVAVLSHLIGKKTFFCPMIKANAYGHGYYNIAQKLKSFGVKKLGVVSVEEALQIKDLAQEIEIYIFGPFEKSEIRFLESSPFIPVVGQWEDLKNLATIKKKMPLHIKFDLGMSRLGFDLSEQTALIKYIKAHPRLCLKGLCAHLNEGEKAGLEDLAQPFWKKSLKESARQQAASLSLRKKRLKHSFQKSPKGGQPEGCEIALFQQLCHKFQAGFPEQKLQPHLLNSAGGLSLWSHSKSPLNLGLRPGISLYGIKPPVLFANHKAKKKYESVPLKPVSCLKSFVAQSRIVRPGQAVSYNKTWRAKKKSCIAVVSLGYADGLPYALSGRGAKVLFRGKKVPIVGRICMDFFMIDLTQVLAGEEPTKRGEEVVIFGPQGKNFIPIEEQAQKACSTPYEFLTRLGNRVKRVFS